LKYKVNLYREREERAVRFRQGLVRGALVGGAVGLEVLLVALLLVAGFSMRNRGRQLDRIVDTLEQEALAKPDRDGLRELRSLVRARLDRVDWTAVLGAVAAATPPEVILTEVRGDMGGRRGRIDGLELEGRFVGQTRELAPVFAFVEALKADSTLSAVFPSVDLGTAKDQNSTFLIICRRGSEEPGS
jgi:Tfp pilus assembly protein PilN